MKNSRYIIVICVIIFTSILLNLNAENFPRLLSFGTTGSDECQLHNPYGITIDEAGYIFATDTGYNSIKKFNISGDFIDAFGRQGNGDGELSSPQGIDFWNGSLYIVDTANHRVVIIKVRDNGYDYISQFGKKGKGNGEFYFPRDIDHDAQGNIFILDSGNDRVQKFSPSGTWLLTIEADGPLKNPYGLDIDPEGNVYIADTFNNRVVKMDQTGRIINAFGSFGSEHGKFAYPRDVAVDINKNIFIADTGNRRIEKYGAQNIYLGSIGGFIEFLTPQKLVIDKNSRLYVIDSNTSRLQIYDIRSYITNLYVTPNPFSPDDDSIEDTASIHYSLPEPSVVTITIYDQNNFLIRALVVNILRANRVNTDVWDGRDDGGKIVKAGIYTIKLNARNNMGIEAPQQIITTTVDYPGGVVSGIVTNVNGPLSGIIVSDGIRKSITDLMGTYSIMRVPAGARTISVENADCDVAPQNITLYTDEHRDGIDFNVACDIPKKAVCEIYGRVTDKYGPVSGATVSNGSYFAVSDARGSYRIIDLPAGVYVITAKKYSFTSTSRTISLDEKNNIKEVNFVLGDIYTNNISNDSPRIRVVPMNVTFSNVVLPAEPTGLVLNKSVAELPLDNRFAVKKSIIRQNVLNDSTIKLEKREIQSSQEQSKKRLTGHILVQLYTIPTPQQKKDFEEHGVTLLGYIPEYTWIANVTGNGPDYLLASDLVKMTAAIAVTDKYSKKHSWDTVPVWADYGDGTARYIVKFHKDITLTQATGIIEKNNGTVLKIYRLSNAFEIRIKITAARQLIGEDYVSWIEYAPPPARGSCDGARNAIGFTALSGSGYDLTGKTITVGMWDGARVDHSHMDFNGRIIFGDMPDVFDKANIDYYRLLGAHATHVAGIIGGSGESSEEKGGLPNQWRGIAPGVKIVSYDWHNTIVEYYHAVNEYDIDISQNSWGWNIGYDPQSRKDYNNRDMFGDYMVITGEIDAIVRGDFGKKISIVFGAGNDRADINPNTGQSDPLDPDGYRSIPPPATAKNIITVGAINSDDDSMTPFSGWGPLDDGRIKPDVVAPGSESSGDGGITSTAPGGGYATYSGTSMAAPIVSGALALLIEAFKRGYGANPLPSTLKALCIHSAKDLGLPGPDYATGYGKIMIDRAVDLVTQKAFIEGLIGHGEEQVYSIFIPDGQEELKVTLAWDDAPKTEMSGKDLVNDLDLVLTSPNGTLYNPFVLNNENPGASSVQGVDHVNVVEQTMIKNPTPGMWTIRISGYLVPEAPQMYSLISENLGRGVSTMHTYVTVYNDGKKDLLVGPITKSKPWLSISNTQLLVRPGTSRQIGITADDAGIESGTYSDSLAMHTNDPRQGIVVIPVTLSVFGSGEDKTPPVISQVSACVGTDCDSDFYSGSRVQFTVIEENKETELDGSMTIYKIKGQGFEPITIPLADNNDGSYSYAWDIPSSQNGNYSVKIILKDKSENESTAYSMTIVATLEDTDGDGIPDAWEIAHGLDPNNAFDREMDPDNDGLTNIEEYTLNSNPLDSDSDDDGMSDGWEIAHNLDPLNEYDAAEDGDGDGQSNLDDYIQNTVKPAIHWKFDEEEGETASDSSGSGFHGTVHGAVWSNGVLDGCLEFNGTDHYVDGTSTQSLDINDLVSIAAWVRNEKDTRYGIPISKGVYNADGWFWWVDRDGWRITFNRKGESYTLHSGYTPSLGEWHHLVAVINNSGKVMQFYADGKLIKTAAMTFKYATDPATPFSVGRYSASDYYWKGKIDDLRVYRHCLQEKEVDTLFRMAVRDNEEQGLVGYWKLDEEKGFLAGDSSGHGNDGDIKGTRWGRGRVGGALDFDGTADYVDFGNRNALAIDKKITIAAWVYNRQYAGNGIPISKGEFQSNGWYWWIDQKGWRVSINSPGKHTEISSGYSVPYDEWHHLAVQIDNDRQEMRFYVDAALIGTHAMPFKYTANSAAHLYFGRYSAPHFNWEGLLDDVRIYNYLPSLSELRDLYENKQLILHLKLDESRGPALMDSSGNGNNGQVFGSQSIQGVVDGAFEFDGTDDYAACGNHGYYNGNNTITVAAWLYGTQSSAYAVPLSGGEYFKDGWYWMVDKNGWRIVLNKPGESHVADSGYSLHLNEWHHLAAVIDNTNLVIKFYVDGRFMTTAPINFAFTAQGGRNIFLGRYGRETGYPWTGAIDDLRIYNYVLGDDGIFGLYSMGQARTEEPLLKGRWEFNERVGQVARDSSGFKSDGNISGSAWCDGAIDGGLKFSAPGDVVYINDRGRLSVKKKLTVAAWLYNAHEEKYGVPISKGLYNGFGWYWWVDTDGWRITINKANQSFTCKAAGMPLLKEWHHLTAVIDNEHLQVHFYIDAKPVNTVAIPFAYDVNDASGLYFGAYNAAGSYRWNGSIDDVHIFNYDLNQSEIQKLYDKNTNTKQAPDMVGHWKLDENTGAVAYDSSGYDNTGKIAGAIWDKGVSNSALSFDGVDDYVGILNNKLIIKDQITISAWVMNRKKSGYGIPIAKGEYDTYGWCWWLDPNGWRVSLHSQGRSQTARSDYFCPLNEWHHLSVTIDNMKMEIAFFVDGKRVKTARLDFPYSEAYGKTVFLGAYSPAKKYNWMGLLDDVRIYNYLLNDDEINEIYSLGLGEAQKPRLTGHWRFDEKEGDTAIDHSGFLNNGQLSGVTRVQGKLNVAVSFDGVDDEVICRNNGSLDARDSLTFAAWVRNDTSSGYSVAASMGTYNTSGWYWVFDKDGMRIVVNGQNENLIINQPNAPRVSEWHHFAMVVDNSSRRISMYIDGVLSSTDPLPFDVVFTKGEPLTLGRYGANEKYFWKGALDDVRMYNYAVNADQVKALYMLGGNTGQ